MDNNDTQEWESHRQVARRLTRLEWQAAALCLARGDGVVGTAGIIGCSRTTIWRAMKRYDFLREAARDQRELRAYEATANLEKYRYRLSDALVREAANGNTRVLLWLAERMGLVDGNPHRINPLPDRAADRPATTKAVRKARHRQELRENPRPPLPRPLPSAVPLPPEKLWAELLQDAPRPADLPPAEVPLAEAPHAVTPAAETLPAETLPADPAPDQSAPAEPAVPVPWRPDLARRLRFRRVRAYRVRLQRYRAEAKQRAATPPADTPSTETTQAETIQTETIQTETPPAETALPATPYTEPSPSEPVDRRGWARRDLPDYLVVENMKLDNPRRPLPPLKPLSARDNAVVEETLAKLDARRW